MLTQQFSLRWLQLMSWSPLWTLLCQCRAKGSDAGSSWPRFSPIGSAERNPWKQAWAACPWFASKQKKRWSARVSKSWDINLSIITDGKENPLLAHLRGANLTVRPRSCGVSSYSSQCLTRALLRWTSQSVSQSFADTAGTQRHHPNPTCFLKAWLGALREESRRRRHQLLRPQWRRLTSGWAQPRYALTWLPWHLGRKSACQEPGWPRFANRATRSTIWELLR